MDAGDVVVRVRAPAGAAEADLALNALWRTLAPLRRVGFEDAGECSYARNGGGCTFVVRTPPCPAAARAAAHLRRSLGRAPERGAHVPQLLPEDLVRAWTRELHDWSELAPLLAALRRRSVAVARSWCGSLPALDVAVAGGRRRVLGPIADGSSSTALFAGSDKLVMRDLLAAIEAPLAPGGAAATLADAEELARVIGYPVVLKAPSSSNSYGVVTGIDGSRPLRRAWTHLRRRHVDGPLALERMAEGRSFRVLVVDGVCVRASEGRPVTVTGDARRSVRELVEESLPGLAADDRLRHRLANVLLGQGLTPESVPPDGAAVAVSPPTAAWRACEEELGPANRALLEEIGRWLAPSILGIDVVCPDLRRDLRDTGGAIVEVNAAPGIGFHARQRELGELLADRLLGSRAAAPGRPTFGPARPG